ncbi:Transposase IS200 like protein [Polystyrenella longa]|uniref:Transposase IS200 like protein n=1 Tax=Polystyrenella longa TaxID=2528007 RepID=A0A518CU49_9PLAN|nr:transposase [Polystyrenella longa]QDU82759.1 Transposase IS200 like protein [Polystyrenella longa]
MVHNHRKTVRHFEDSPDIHELTFSCHQRKPLLVNETWKKLLAEHITRAMARHRYGLIAFVLMPEHVHLLVTPQPGSGSISTLLSGIKRPFSYRIKQELIKTDSPLLNELMMPKRDGEFRFRFWLDGPGYDRNITNQKTLELAINYIHENPVKRGLVERAVDWKWSSGRSYVLPETPPDSELPRIDKLDSFRLEK